MGQDDKSGAQGVVPSIDHVHQFSLGHCAIYSKAIVKRGIRPATTRRASAISTLLSAGTTTSALGLSDGGGWSWKLDPPMTVSTQG